VSRKGREGVPWFFGSEQISRCFQAGWIDFVAGSY
jgi:hypothetical protein